MQWQEETVHALVVMHDWKQQKQLKAAIRDLERLALRRAVQSPSMFLRPSRIHQSTTMTMMRTNSPNAAR